ncbi:hypothetical protein [Paenibacillus taichungensis]|uniref:hypothetical protein n=1 Tax=Paenibacillus taichungensis TaxID=484184 RepID=UPI0038D08A7B
MELTKLFELIDLHYEIQNDIQASHVSHAAFAIVNKHFYTKDGMVDIETARSESLLSPDSRRY